MWDLRNRDVLEWLIQPYSLEEFAHSYYESKPLYITGRPADYFAGCFGLDEVERILYGGSLQAGEVFVAKNGVDVPPQSYLRTTTGAPNRQGGQTEVKEVVDAHRVGTLFAQGSTIVGDVQIHEYASPMAAAVRRLAVFFGHDVFAGFFLTPPACRGFDVHYDCSDTFILQIEGKKNWRLYAPQLELPLKSQNYDPKTCKPGPMLLDVTLSAGDVLYMPRGTFHEPRSAEDSHSLHVTVGLSPITWSSVIETAIANASKAAVQLRKSTLAPLDRAVLESIVRDALQEDNLQSILDKMERGFKVKHRNALNGQLRQILALRNLTEESNVMIRRDTLYDLEDAETGTILRLFGSEIRLSKTAFAIVRDLEASAILPVASLMKHGADVIGTLRRLIDCGLVLQAAGAGSGSERAPRMSPRNGDRVYGDRVYAPQKGTAAGTPSLV